MTASAKDPTPEQRPAPLPKPPAEETGTQVKTGEPGTTRRAKE